MKVVARLEITQTEDGQIHVSGPIGDRYVCYGLLEVAKDAIREHNAQTEPMPGRRTLLTSVSPIVPVGSLNGKLA